MAKYVSPFNSLIDSTSDTSSGGRNSYSSPFSALAGIEVIRRKKQEEDAYNSEVLKQEQAKEADKKQAEINSKKSVKDRFGDIAIGTGRFIKSAGQDLKDTTVGVWQGMGDIVRGELASDNLEEVTKARTEMSQRHSKEMNEILGNAEDATKLDAAGKKKWDDFVARSNKEREEFNAANAEKEKAANEDIGIAQKVDAKKLAFQSGETVINIATLGIGSVPKQLAKQGLKVAAKQAFKTAVKTGGKELLDQVIKEGGEQLIKKGAQEVLEEGAEQVVKQTGKQIVKKAAQEGGKDALIGAAYGVTQTGKNNPDAELNDYLINSAFGAGIGFAIPFAGAGAKAGIGKVKAGRAGAKVADVALDNSDLNKALNETIEKESSKYDAGVVNRLKTGLATVVDPYYEAAKIDAAWAKKNGIKHSGLSALDSVEDAMRRSNNFDATAKANFSKKTATGDSLQDLVYKYKGDSEKGLEFNNFGNNLHLLEVLDKKPKYILPVVNINGTPTRLTKEMLQESVDAYKIKNVDWEKDTLTKKGVLDQVVDTLTEHGALDAEDAARIKSAYKYPVPMDKVFPDDLNGVPVGGKNLGSIAKQTVIKRIEQGSDAPISNSFDSIMNRVYKAESQAKRAEVGRMLLKRAKEGFVPGSNVTFTGDNKIARNILKEQAQLISKGVRYINSKVKMSNREVKKLDSELSKLNLEGLGASIKSAGTDAPKQPIKTVTVKTVKEQIRENAPKTLDDLNQSYIVKDALQKEYGKGANAIAQMAADVYNGGWTQLRALNPDISEATAKSIAGQVLKKPTIKGAQTIVTEGKIGKSPTIRSVIKTMLDSATPTSEVIKIQKKIALREPKLAKKLDDVLNYKQQIEALKLAKSDIRDVAADFKDDPLTGKPVISGVEDGVTWKMEVTPAIEKMMKGLDEKQLDSVTKTVGLLKKPFEVAWVGVVNPQFALKSAIFFDPIMSVINTPRGFKTLFPDAVKEGFKSLFNKSELQDKLVAHGITPHGATGAAMSGRVDAQALAAQRSAFSRFKYNATHPEAAINRLDVFGGKLSNATRMRVAKAEYNHWIKKGATENEALANATMAWRTVLPDYNTQSNLVRQINAFVPFFGASTSGTRAFGKALKRDPKGVMAKSIGLGIVPAAAVTAYSMGQTKGPEFYKDMEDSGKGYVLDNNMIIVLPTAKKDDSTGKWSGIIKIPIAPEFKAVNRSVWRSVRGATTEQEGASPAEVSWSIFDTLTGGIRSGENPLVSTRRILSGEDPRTGERIIRGDMANLPKEEQMYDSTSGVGKFVGKVLGTSPIQGDKLLGQFGIAGEIAKGKDPITANKEQAVNTVSGAYGESASRAFYDTYSPVKAKRDKVSKEVTTLIQTGRINEAKRKAEEFNSTLGGKFSEFSKEYSGSEVYDPNWDEMMSGLFIRTGERSIEARQRQ